MIVCHKCLATNGDADAFCGSCGAFLEWTGEKVVPAAPAEPESPPDPPQPATQPPQIRRGQNAVTAGGRRSRRRAHRV
jgi:hypothetical protein